MLQEYSQRLKDISSDKNSGNMKVYDLQKQVKELVSFSIFIYLQ